MRFEIYRLSDEADKVTFGGIEPEHWKVVQLVAECEAIAKAEVSGDG